MLLKDRMAPLHVYTRTSSLLVLVLLPLTITRSSAQCFLCGTDGVAPAFPTKSVEYSGTTYTCTELAELTVDEEDCSAYQAVGTAECGCEEAEETGACSLCEENTLPLPDFQPIDDRSCARLEELAKDRLDSLCPAAQATYGVLCGCDNPIAEQRPDLCRICGRNVQLVSPGNTFVVSGEDISCLDLEFSVNAGLFEGISCEEFQAGFFDNCCLEPDTSPTTSPGSFQPSSSSSPGSGGPTAGSFAPSAGSSAGSGGPTFDGSGSGGPTVGGDGSLQPTAGSSSLQPTVGEDSLDTENPTESPEEPASMPTPSPVQTPTVPSPVAVPSNPEPTEAPLAGESSDPCSLCPNPNHQVAWPDATLVETFVDLELNISAQVCQELETEILKIVALKSDSEECKRIQDQYGVGNCGCPPRGGRCTFCHDHEQPTGDATKVVVNTTTCGDLQIAAPLISASDPDCDGAQLGGYVSCGCPSLPVAPAPGQSKVACTLCADRSEPKSLTATTTIDVDGSSTGSITCAQAYELAPFIENSAECEAAQQKAGEDCGCPLPCTLCADGRAPRTPRGRFHTGKETLTCIEMYNRQPLILPEANCTALQKVGQQVCGCGATPLINNCSLCEDGATLPKPLGGAFGRDPCSLAAINARRDLVGNCPAWQATAGSYCGCNNTNAMKNACLLCGAGNELPNPQRRVIVSGSNVTCGFLEFEANKDSQQLCNTTRRLHRAACCAAEQDPRGASSTLFTARGLIWTMSVAVGTVIALSM